MKAEPEKTADLSDALIAATEAINAGTDVTTAESQIERAVTALEQEAGSQQQVPFVYDTETTEVARTFVNQIDRLTRLIAEDDAELDFIAKDRDRQIHELQLRFEAEQDAILNNARQASEIATARRADRAKAKAPIEAVVKELKKGNGNG